MTRSRLIVSVLFMFLFFAYYLYCCSIAIRRLGNESDNRTYNPVVVTQHARRSTNFFNRKPSYEHWGRIASSEWNMVGTKICTILYRVFHEDSPTIVNREEVPKIIPPLPKTGCEESGDALEKALCEGKIQKIIIIAVCVGAGLIAVPTIFFTAWTLKRWIQVVRPKKRTILIRKEPKKGAFKGYLQELLTGREVYIDEGNGGRAGTRKVKNRIEEKEVWYGGVRITLPWGRGTNWDRAVPQFPGRGTAQGLLVGLSPDSSSRYVLESGQFDRRSRAASGSILAVSTNTRDGGTRVASTGREAPTDEGAFCRVKRSDLCLAPDLKQ